MRLIKILVIGYYSYVEAKATSLLKTPELHVHFILESPSSSLDRHAAVGMLHGSNIRGANPLELVPSPFPTIPIPGTNPWLAREGKLLVLLTNTFPGTALVYQHLYCPPTSEVRKFQKGMLCALPGSSVCGDVPSPCWPPPPPNRHTKSQCPLPCPTHHR